MLLNIKKRAKKGDAIANIQVYHSAMTLVLCKRSMGKIAHRLTVGITVDTFGAIPATQPRREGLVCCPRRTKDGHKCGPCKGWQDQHTSPVKPQSIQQHSPQEDAGTWIPTPCCRLEW